MKNTFCLLLALLTLFSCQYDLHSPDSNLPVVSTNMVASIIDSSAISGGTVSWSGTSPFTARGICWSTTGNPTITGYHTSNGTGTGTFAGNMAPLSIFMLPDQDR